MDEMTYEDLPGYGPLRPIFDAVGREYQMTLKGMLHSKSPTPLRARQVCCWLASELNIKLTFMEIAAVLKRSRNSAPQGIAAINKLRASDSELREMTDRLLTELRRA